LFAPGANIGKKKKNLATPLCLVCVCYPVQVKALGAVNSPPEYSIKCQQTKLTNPVKWEILVSTGVPTTDN
jgi:hypothetical protein